MMHIILLSIWGSFSLKIVAFAESLSNSEIPVKIQTLNFRVLQDKNGVREFNDDQETEQSIFKYFSEYFVPFILDDFKNKTEDNRGDKTPEQYCRDYIKDHYFNDFFSKSYLNKFYDIEQQKIILNNTDQPKFILNFVRIQKRDPDLKPLQTTQNRGLLIPTPPPPPPELVKK
jgi:hypothetical protein